MPHDVIEIVNKTNKVVEIVEHRGMPGVVDPAMYVIADVPSGAVNGSNATFLTTFDFIPESVQVFVNGVFQKKTEDFNTSGTNTIILAVSPLTGEVILVNYLRS